MATTRNIVKSLAVMEDMAVGRGTVLQKRGTGTEVDLHVVVESAEALVSIDTDKYTRARVYSGATYVDYVYLDTQWELLANNSSLALKIFQSPTDGGLTEIQTRTVESGEVYEVRKTSDDSLATIYSDAAGTTEIAQNGTSNVSGSAGVVEFYVADGEYYIEAESSRKDLNVVTPKTDFATIAEAISYKNLKQGMFITCQDYAEGNGAGVLFFKVVSAGTGVHDGGKYIDAPLLNLQLSQNLKKPYSAKAWGAVGGVDVTTNLQNWLDFSGNSSLTLPFHDTEGYIVSDELTVKSNTTLTFENGARIKAVNMTGKSVLKTREGSGNDLFPPVIAQTNITIKNPWITLQGDGCVGIKASPAGHDIHIENPTIRTLDNAPNQVGIMEVNCFNVNLYNPSIVLGGVNSTPIQSLHYKFQDDGTTPYTGYSVMTNNVIRSGTVVLTGTNQVGIEYKSSSSPITSTGGVRGDGFKISNMAILAREQGDGHVGIKVDGPLIGLNTDTLHVEEIDTFYLATVAGDVKATHDSVSCQGSLVIFDTKRVGQSVTSDNLSVVTTPGQSPANIAASDSLGVLLVSFGSASSSTISDLENPDISFSTRRGQSRQFDVGGSSYSIKTLLDDSATIIHTASTLSLSVSLPENAPKGVSYNIVKPFGSGLNIVTPTSDRMVMAGVTNSIGVGVSSSTTGASITVEKTSNGWFVTSFTGDWV